jgi:hypothetical protein
MYNVTFRHVSVTIVVVEKQYVLYIVSVCSLRYTACSAHAPYFIAKCGLSVCTTYFRINSYTIDPGCRAV